MRRVLFCLMLIAGTAEADESPSPEVAAGERAIDFASDIQPIFAARCLKCHGSDAAEGGLQLTNRAAAIEPLDSGSHAIVPGKPATSELLQRIATTDADLRMPPDGPALTEREIASLKQWIAEGADWPEHWAYRELKRPPVPSAASEHGDWPRTPIDRFVLEELESRGLQPSPAADKRTLLRRVYFDLIGMPPTAEEVAAFLADASPHAYEAVVDRLLASPHHGERWARHWMDVVHYAETHGHDQDRPRDHAWPYRDYLIRSFNEDKPYARFVQEQIAGDALFPNDPQAIVATGMLATGPWDESSLRDIREDTLDREIARYLDRDDIVTTVMSTFASSTVHCARCHDHKFDPISQREYYGLQAIFAATDKANRSFDADSKIANRRRELTAAIGSLPDRIERADETLLSDELSAEVARWEVDIEAAANRWQSVELLKFESVEGSELKQQSDGSILASGPRPEKDVYTITFRASQKHVTGLLVEVLTDKSLPHAGPGRQDNGNLHLNEIRLLRISEHDSEAESITLKSPVADFNQLGWSIEKAIDDNLATAWGIYPEVGKPHRAAFAVANGGDTEPAKWKLELHQVHGGGHLIGRVRISTTDASGPHQLGETAIDPAVAEIIRSPKQERTRHQRAALAGAYLTQKLSAELKSLPPMQLVYCGTNKFQADGSFRPSASPRTVHVLNRGSVTSPLDEAQPTALSCLPTLSGVLELEDPTHESQRRAALARWMTDPRNGLAWRSIANRIWHFHFGQGIVVTPNDFGRMGAVPSHRELLDWLAVELFENGGSLKHLHRLIVTSAAYRQSSMHNPAFAEIDANNRFLWRMNRQRLDAESIRDAVLLISGKLDTTMYGPSVRQFNQSPGVHVTPVIDYANFSVDDPANHRRSVYRFVFRTLPDPFMDALDCPDASQLAPRRSASITALQALAMLNDKLIVRHSESIAERVERNVGSDAPMNDRVNECFRLILAREATDREQTLVSAYVAQRGLANACRFLLNSNEFMFLD